MNSSLFTKILLSGAAISIFALPRTSVATSGTWVGGGTSDFYSNTTNWSGGIVATGTDATATLPSASSIYLDANQTLGNITANMSGAYWYVNFHGATSDVLDLATSSGTPTMNLASWYNGRFDWGTMTIAGNQGLDVGTGYNTLVLQPSLSWTATGTLAYYQPGTDPNNVFALGNNVLPSTMDLDVTGGSAGSLTEINGGTTQTIGALTGNSSDYIATYSSGSGLHANPGGTNGSTSAATLQIGNTNSNGAFGGVLGENSSSDTADASSEALNITKVGTGTQTFSGSIYSTGSMTVSSGTMQLSGATLSVTGATNVNSGGTLEISGINTETAGSEGRIYVNTGGTLAGNGTLNLSDTTNSLTGLDVFGNVSPGVGNTIGTLTFDGASSDRSIAAFENGSTFTMKLGLGLTADVIAFTDSHASDVFFGNDTINFDDLTNGSLSDGQYVLFTADAANAFDEGEYSALRTNGSGYVTAGLSLGTGLTDYPGSNLQLVGNNIVLNVVPEPGTWGLLAGGIGILGLWQRARQRSRRGFARR